MLEFNFVHFYILSCHQSSDSDTEVTWYADTHGKRYRVNQGNYQTIFSISLNIRLIYIFMHMHEWIIFIFCFMILAYCHVSRIVCTMTLNDTGYVYMVRHWLLLPSLGDSCDQVRPVSAPWSQWQCQLTRPLTSPTFSCWASSQIPGNIIQTLTSQSHLLLLGMVSKEFK